MNKDLIEASKDADLVIEAVVEKLDVKQKLCKTVIENSPDHCIFASNTSTISITEIAQNCGKPENVIGMHFFNPAPLMRLIEVIKGDKSSDEAIETAIQVSKNLPCLRGERYVALVLKSRPGFIVNRVLAPSAIYSNYIIDLAYEKGIPWEQVDADLSRPNTPMSALTLSDFTGRDIAYNGGLYYAEKLSPDFKPGKVITEMYESGNLGQKTGKGFYDWSQGRDAIMAKVKAASPAGLFDLNKTFAILLNEGCRILDEGITTGFKTIDDANMAGMNAPGPFSAGKKNFENWAKLLEQMADDMGKDYLRPIELMKSGGFAKMRK